MKRIVGLALGGCLAAVIACAGGSHYKASTPAPTSSAPPGGAAPVPGDPRAEIDQLDAKISAELAQLGFATDQPAACAVTRSCTPQPMSLPPRVEDSTCKPAANETCTQACTLSDSVCTNATRICELAKQLGGADAYANEKCQRGNESCARTRDKCCGCT